MAVIGDMSPLPVYPIVTILSNMRHMFPIRAILGIIGDTVIGNKLLAVSYNGHVSSTSHFGHYRRHQYRKPPL